MFSFLQSYLSHNDTCSMLQVLLIVVRNEAYESMSGKRILI